jgi:NTE family protein
MDASAFLRPDVLVLAGGGIVGEAWMNGLLAGIEDGANVDLRTVEAFVGTSAGSIVAARLVAGRRLPRPGSGHDTGAAFAEAAASDAESEAEAESDEARDRDRDPSGLRGVLRQAARVGWAASAPVAGAALALGAPAGALARAALLSRAAARGRPLTPLRDRIADWAPRFDGRLRVCSVDRRSGRRVVFGAPDAPPAEVADAVCASCAIPWVFSPVRIGDREYVDGGVWSVTNLDAARAGRGTHILCLDPAAALGGSDRRIAALRAAVRAASGLEIQALRRRGARVLHIAPDADSSAAMGINLMAPGHTGRALAAGYRQGVRLAR